MKTTVPSKKPDTKNHRPASKSSKANFSPMINSPVGQILHLQRTIGNQAVQRLFKSSVIPAKLKIGQPNDIYEQEADRVVEQVMNMPEPRLQRQAEEEDEEEELIQTKPLAEQITPLVQRQIEEEEEEPLQAKSVEDATPAVTHNLESRINAIRGGGQPLAESERAFFEHRFGYDFSRVRVHTDARAVESARAVNARAYTIGQDVVLAVEVSGS